MVEQLTQLERCDIAYLGRTGQEGEEGNCPVCGRAAEVHGVLPGEGDEPAESLWVRFRGQINMG